MEKEKKTKRVFTPEQKYQIIKDIESCRTAKEGLEKYNLCYSVYTKWKRQLEVGVNACLRNGKPYKSTKEKKLAMENRKLKEMVLTLSQQLCELKKEMNWD